MSRYKETRCTLRGVYAAWPARPTRVLAGIAIVLAATTLSGCSTTNSMMGGNTRKQAMAEIAWDFGKDAVMIEVAAETGLNQYAGESHTLLLGIYQMADSAAFYKMIADPAAMAKSMGSGKGGDGFVQFSRYVVTPGQRSILILDRAQNAKFIGIAAGYYHMAGDSSARLFEVPLTISSKGMLSTTYTAAPAPLAVRMTFGADAIVNAERLNHDPSEKKMQEAVPLDGGGKEIKLTPDNVKDAAQMTDSLHKLKD